MGLSSKKTTTTQTNKPIYSAQVEGAANAQQAAYNGALPGINKVSGDFLGLSNDLLERYKQGDPTIDAARGYIENTLGATPGDNPHLQGIIDRTNESTRAGVASGMGTRGLSGGSVMAKILADRLAGNEGSLRYQAYGDDKNRQAQAAGMAPGVVAGSYIPVAAAMDAGQQGAMLPLQAALANSAGVGGLLGQYQDVKGTQKSSGGLLGGLLGSVLSGWASGGFGGFGGKG